MFKAINFQRNENGRSFAELRIIFRAAVFLLLLGLVFFKLQEVSFAGIEKITANGFLFIPLVLVSILLNQYCEFRKWKALARLLNVDRKEMVKSYFDGSTAGFITPNGWGTFLGRMVHVDRQKRADLVLGTALSNASQFLPTLFFGGFAFLAVDKFPPIAGELTIVASIILIIAFGLSHPILSLFTRAKVIQRLGQFSERPFGIKWELLFWSFLRYGTFLLQYLLFFQLFGYYNYAEFLPRVAVLFILTSVVPSLWSGKVLIRETAAIFLFAETGFLIGDVVLICLLVWLSNVIVPVIFGAVRNLLTARKPTVHALD